MTAASIPTPPDVYEEWFREQPSLALPDDSPFTIRPARPEDFETVYETVDAAFGKKRPRALYDWLYCRNPMGLARVWLQFERETGLLVKTGASFPWPIWRGNEALLGSVGGDAATLPQWQRKGLNHIRRPIIDSHPWYPKICGISGPNANSRAVAKRLGRGKQVLGRLRGGLAPLRSAPMLSRLGLPGPLSTALGSVSDGFFSLWPGRGAVSDKPPGRRVEEIRRFDSGFDSLTLQHMSSPRYWCPHNADFLNWRYLDHPVESYVGLVLLENERPEGYAVVRLAGQGATLVELVVAPEPPHRARDLLRDVMSVALDAGCAYLNFFATPGWHHWGTLRRAGFLPYASPNFLEVVCPDEEPEILRMENWQILPGDRDYH